MVVDTKRVHNYETATEHSLLHLLAATSRLISGGHWGEEKR